MLRLTDYSLIKRLHGIALIPMQSFSFIMLLLSVFEYIIERKVGELEVKTGTVFNIQKFCIHDGDGIRTCVFVKGCPLRCIWCHNPESLDKDAVLSFSKKNCSLCGKCLDVCSLRSVKNGVITVERNKCALCGKCIQICPNGANEIIGKNMTAREVIDEVMKDKLFYDTSGGGLTVTGGEPSYRADFTLELLQLAKAEGISVAVETCGIGSRDFYEKAAALGTVFLYDIKCIDSERHKSLTGADNTHIISNLNYLMDAGADIIIRMPLIPQCNDSDSDIAALARFLNEKRGRYRYAEIMPYHSLGTAKSEKIGSSSLYVHENASEADISRWLTLFASHGTDVRVSE